MKRYLIGLLMFVSVMCNDVGISPENGSNAGDTTQSADMCSPAVTTACTDTTDSLAPNGDSIRLITVWEPHQSVFFELTYVNGWFDPLDSYRHVYDASLRDSIVYWLEFLDENDTTYRGWGEYHYDTDGRLRRIDNFNGWDSLQYGYFVYDTAGTLREAMQDGFVQEYDDRGNLVRTYFVDDTTEAGGRE